MWTVWIRSQPHRGTSRFFVVPPPKELGAGGVAVVRPSAALLSLCYRRIGRFPSGIIPMDRDRLLRMASQWGLFHDTGRRIIA